MSAYLSSSGTITTSFKKVITTTEASVLPVVIHNETINKASKKMFASDRLEAYTNIEEAKQSAKIQNKPIFTSFINQRSKNCKKMNAKICKNSRVLKILNKYYVVLILCCSDKNSLSKQEHYKSKYDGKLIRTIGSKNNDYQITQFFNNIQPFYALTDANQKLLIPPKGYDLEVSNFITFLKKGIKSNNIQNVL